MFCGLILLVLCLVALGFFYEMWTVGTTEIPLRSTIGHLNSQCPQKYAVGKDFVFLFIWATGIVI